MNFTICSCCGTEFEYDDYRTSYQELRRRWIAQGCRWFSPIEHAPLNWNPVIQLFHAQFSQGTSANNFPVLGTLGGGAFASPNRNRFANLLNDTSHHQEQSTVFTR